MHDSNPLRIALVGIGEVARNGHLPTILARRDVELLATVGLNGKVTGFPVFTTIAEAFEHFPQIQAVVLCTPPNCRYQLAKEVIQADRHVFLEKPPGSTLAEIMILQHLAIDHGVTLFTGWHSRCTGGTKLARQWLNDKSIKCVRITWKEDVRHWHPGQDWLFERGGMGVFDTGINALSIATHILPRPFALTDAVLHVPANRQAPIAAFLTFADYAGIPITAEFDFRHQSGDIWEIEIITEQGHLQLFDRGFKLSIDGTRLKPEAGIDNPSLAASYAELYDHFIELTQTAEQHVDILPLVHVADAFMLAERRVCEAFNW